MKGIKLSYELRESGKLEEYFKPYSVKFLKDIGVLEKHIDLSETFDAFDGLEVGEIELQEMPNDLSNWTSSESTINDSSLFDYFADILFVSSLFDDEKNNESRIKIGVVTEIMKVVMDGFKINISLVFLLWTNILKNPEVISLDELLELIKQVVERAFWRDYTVDDFEKDYEKDNVSAFKNLILNLYRPIQKGISFNFLYFPQDDYLKLLHEYFNNKGAYLQSHYKDSTNNKSNGCYCIIENAGHIYFSFSGYDVIDFSFRPTEKFNTLNEKVTLFLESITNKKNFEWKRLSPSVKSYGYPIYFKSKFKGNDFIPYPVPICLGDEPCLFRICHKKIGSEYGCCERKIFVDTENKSLIKIGCRWAPCKKCFPAIIEQLNLHSQFEYKALAKDFNDFRNNPNRENLWILTKDSGGYV